MVTHWTVTLYVRYWCWWVPVALDYYITRRLSLSLGIRGRQAQATDSATDPISFFPSCGLIGQTWESVLVLFTAMSPAQCLASRRHPVDTSWMNEWSDELHASVYRTGNGFVHMKPASFQGFKLKSLLRRESYSVTKCSAGKTITPCPTPIQWLDVHQPLEKVALLA